MPGTGPSALQVLLVQQAIAGPPIDVFRRQWFRELRQHEPPTMGLAWGSVGPSLGVAAR